MKTSKRILGTSFVLLAGLAVRPLPAAANDASTTRDVGPYVNWSYPGEAPGFRQVSQRITLLKAGPTTYWSMPWGWLGKPSGGYAGIQTDGNRQNGTAGPLALFSVWSATKAHPGPGSACGPFTGEGEGMSCSMPFEVRVGNTYRIEISAVRTDADGRWWRAVVTNETNGQVADVGEIATPADYLLGVPTNFTEFFGGHQNCDDFPRSEAIFYPPAMTPDKVDAKPVDGGFNDGQVVAKSCAPASLVWTPAKLAEYGVQMTFGSVDAASPSRPPAPAPTKKSETGPNIYWHSPTPEERFIAVSQRYTPHQLGETLYWATHWFWHGIPNGGYAGIQTDGVRANGSRGKMAIFSIWDATEAEPGQSSAGCIRFGGEGEGMSCRAPMEIDQGHTYRTDVKLLSTGKDKKWWQATITDETTGAVVNLGRIATSTAAVMKTPSTFLEYFGPSQGCERHKIVTTDFSAPLLTPEGSATALPATFNEGIRRSCALSVIKPAAEGVTMDTYVP